MQKSEWENITSIGMISSHRLIDGKISIETRFYISNLDLTPLELIEYTRNEWRVETMHWLLDIHFREDECRLNHPISQKNLNALRKLLLNIINIYKNKTNSKIAISKVMLNALLSGHFLANVINSLNS